MEYKNRITLDRIYLDLFKKMVNAPINEFYDVTPTYAIVQRFHDSIDCFQNSIIDSILRIFSSLSDFLIKISIFASVSNWMAAICLVAAYQLVINQIKWRVVVQKFYSFENYLKRLDVSTYTTFTGGPLIKCFGKQQHFIDKKRFFMDTREQINLIHRSGTSYSEMRSEVIQSLFFAVACYTIVVKRGQVSPVILSTIFFDSMTISWMSNTVWGYNWLVDNLERAKWALAMQKICPQEKQTAEVQVDPEVWPMHGQVEFKDIRLKYRKHLPEVLQGLSFKIAAGEKVGLVGRTGAGKSTISLAIPRIVEAFSGVVEIDGIDISKVDLHMLRNKLTVVPQEPVLFNGTLRFNLDPHN